MFNIALFMDWQFISGCLPPRLSTTQFPSITDSQCSVRWGLPPHCWCALSGARRDALPRDPRRDVRWLSSGAAPLIGYAFRRVRRSTSTDAFQTCDAGRAGVHLPSEAGTLDMTIRRPAADRTGARPGAGDRAASVLLFSRVAHTQKQQPSGQSFFRTLLGQE